MNTRKTIEPNPIPFRTKCNVVFSSDYGHRTSWIADLNVKIIAIMQNALPPDRMRNSEIRIDENNHARFFEIGIATGDASSTNDFL